MYNIITNLYRTGGTDVLNCLFYVLFYFFLLSFCIACHVLCCHNVEIKTIFKNKKNKTLLNVLLSEQWLVRYISVVRVKQQDLFFVLTVHQMDMEIRRRPHLKAYTVQQNVISVIHNTSPR